MWLGLRTVLDLYFTFFFLEEASTWPGHIYRFFF
jgi:hypothetical protein